MGASARAFGDHARQARDILLICFLVSRLESRISLSKIALRYRISNLQCHIVILWTLVDRDIFRKILVWKNADKIIRIIIRVRKMRFRKNPNWRIRVACFVCFTTSHLIDFCAAKQLCEYQNGLAQWDVKYTKIENFRTIKLSDKMLSESLFVRDVVMSERFFVRKF